MDKITEIAHEIWAAAQLMPGEGIEDGVRRVEEILMNEWGSLDAVTDNGKYCTECGAPLTYYHDTERTRAVCSAKCQGWNVVEEIDHKPDKGK